MAEAVRNAFARSRNLMVEAGTGVGKSMAYLLPAAIIARDNGINVGVATKTNALLDQLVYHELPALSEELGADLTYAALKGFSHYPVCTRWSASLWKAPACAPWGRSKNLRLRPLPRCFPSLSRRLTTTSTA